MWLKAALNGIYTFAILIAIVAAGAVLISTNRGIPLTDKYVLDYLVSYSKIVAFVAFAAFGLSLLEFLFAKKKT